MRKSLGLAVMALVLVAALAGGAAAQQSLTWTAGAVGGGWYAISGGMAELLREKAGLNIKVIPGGGTQNPLLVEKGEAELGMGLPPLLGAAFRGEDPYPGQKMDKLRALAGNMSLNTFHFYVAADSPFAKMTMDEIFKGKKAMRLAISKPGSSDVWVFEKIMEFYGYCQPGKTATRPGRRPGPSSSAAPTPNRRAPSRTATSTGPSRSWPCPAHPSPRPRSAATSSSWPSPSRCSSTSASSGWVRA
jgi:TRAP-type uncharacterized transport system substrate-binding protein